MKRIRVWVVAVGVLLFVSAGTAAAQSSTYHGFATAFAGWAGGGDLPRAAIPVGGAVSVIESSGWGADMDISFSDDDSGGRHTDVLAFMVNANWTKPTGVWRPYISGGAGLLRLHGCLSGCPVTTSTTDLGANAGGGTYVRVSDIVFVRGELKYLWAPGKHPDSSRPDNFGFFRATIGVTVSWAITP